MQNVLVLGVDTVLGSNLALEFARWFDVFGMFTSFAVEIDGCQTEKRPDSPDELLARVDQVAPRWVVLCGDLSQSSWLDVETPRSDVDVAQTLLDGSRNFGYRLTVISSDAVFTGPRLFHDEDAPRLGTGVFARQACQLERMLADTSALVVRTHAYGWSPAPDFVPGIEQLWDRLRFSTACELDTKRYATPILASDLASLLCRAMDRELAGLYHIAGAERINPYRFGVEMAAAFGLPSNRVHCRVEECRGAASTVPSERSLATHRARGALATPMPLVRDGLKRLAEQAEQGTPSRLRIVEPIPTAA